MLLLENSWDLNAREMAAKIAKTVPRELIALFAASVVVLVFSIYGKDISDFYDYWAIACSGVSILVTTCLLALFFFNPQSTGSCSGLVHIFLFVWWVIGA